MAGNVHFVLYSVCNCGGWANKSNAAFTLFTGTFVLGTSPEMPSKNFNNPEYTMKFKLHRGAMFKGSYWPFSHFSLWINFVSGWIFGDSRSQLWNYPGLGAVLVENTDITEHGQTIPALPCQNWITTTMRLKKINDCFKPHS